MTTPDAPENVRLIDADGNEITPERIDYLGPDPETDTHVFEAWFPATVDIESIRNIRIAVLPAMTSVHIRHTETGMTSLRVHPEESE